MYHLPILLILLLSISPILTPFLSRIPNTLLASVILFALRKLFRDFAHGHTLRQEGKRIACVLWSIVIAITIAFGPTTGLIVGIAVDRCIVCARYALGRVVDTSAPISTAPEGEWTIQVKGLAYFPFYHRQLEHELLQAIQARPLKQIKTIHLQVTCFSFLQRYASTRWSSLANRLASLQSLQEHAIQVRVFF